MGLLLRRCHASMVFADDGGRACPDLYCLGSQTAVSIFTRSVVFHTLVLVESIDIGTFAKAGQPALEGYRTLAATRSAIPCRTASMLSTMVANAPLTLPATASDPRSPTTWPVPLQRLAVRPGCD